MKCFRCGADDELRFGCCWDCATAGETRAAKRTVVQHLGCMFSNLRKRNGNAKYDMKWAWARLTKTGDYAPGGYFERSNIQTNRSETP